MSILKVARMGHPVLRQVAKPVKESQIRTREFQQLIDDMIETMREYDGVGLAAPQVHESVRLCIVEIESDNPRYKGQDAPTGLQIFVNPVIKPLTEETDSFWEGCLSIPGLRGLVSRPTKIQVNTLDRDGKKHEFVADGFLAIVLQHEFDHLDGKLYIDRITDMKDLAFDQEYEKYIAHPEKAAALD